ncbi:response regulator [Dyella sp.]|jgi:DNA-binding NtrC family response regulator|uniref:response regulator n=1 Tax=Dyella sp. TaxID=1869338 RepID=UPI002BEA1A75|nr:response regulator [Dyella sp.]HTC26276.1 response regulator [Dyella sp.]
MHVLVIENDRDTREVLSSILDDAGYTVLQASKVSDGLRLARLNSHIGVGLVDIHLGDRLTGLEILRSLQDRLPLAQFILLSGDWDALEKAVPDARILRKPCGRTEVLGLVSTAFEEFKSKGGSAAAPQFIRRHIHTVEG